MSISLKNIILGINLDEGLIKTYPIEKSVDILNRDSEFSSIYRTFISENKWIVVEFNVKDLDWESRKIEHFSENYAGLHKGDKIEYPISKLNSFGYIPTYVKILSNEKIKDEYKFSYNRLKKDIDQYNGDVVNLYFGKKYSDIIGANEMPKSI